MAYGLICAMFKYKLDFKNLTWKKNVKYSLIIFILITCCNDTVFTILRKIKYKYIYVIYNHHINNKYITSK